MLKTDETSETRFFRLVDTADPPIHLSIRLRVQHYAEQRAEPVIA